MWGNVKAEDIGSGFRRANKEIADQLIAKGKTSSQEGRRIDALYRKLHQMEDNDERNGRERHKFLNGNSRFIFYVLRPPKIIRGASKKKSAINAINAQNTVTPKQRVKFAHELGTNIDRTTKFFVEEILPRTEAIVTSLTNVDEVMQQIADDKARLPTEFIKRKVTDAVYLRIIRFISSQYGLNKEEQKLMLAEFVAKSRPPLF